MVTLPLTLLIGPRPIPKRHDKRQNFKAAVWRLTLDARCVHSFTKPLANAGFSKLINICNKFKYLSDHSLVCYLKGAETFRPWKFCVFKEGSRNPDRKNKHSCITNVCSLSNDAALWRHICVPMLPRDLFCLYAHFSLPHDSLLLLLLIN